MEIGCSELKHRINIDNLYKADQNDYDIIKQKWMLGIIDEAIYQTEGENNNHTSQNKDNINEFNFNMPIMMI